MDVKGGSNSTHEVGYETQVCHGQQGSQDVQRDVVEHSHVYHNKVHVDGTNNQYHDAPSNFPRPKGGKKGEKEKHFQNEPSIFDTDKSE